MGSMHRQLGTSLCSGIDIGIDGCEQYTPVGRFIPSKAVTKGSPLFLHIGPARAMALAVVATVLVVPAVAYASHKIGSKSGEGDFAIAIASGQANHPSKLSVKITSKPAQRVTGNWTVICSKGTSAGSKSGELAGVGTFTRNLKMSTRHPDTCTVSAAGSLDHGGKIRVTLLAD
jgi:hypothetical protein